MGWSIAFGVFFTLMVGGVFGLEPIGTDRWGGLPLTVILTLIGMTASTPIGIAFALARRSSLALLRSLAIGYIELVRGVPLITVLFVATFVFPLVLPAGWRTRPVLARRHRPGHVPGGVHGGDGARWTAERSRAQYEAATSLGLGYWQVQRAVILPQALVAVIPAFVNNLLSTFMDTSLVAVVSMYDLTGSLRLALGDPRWRDFFVEGYLFVGAIYFLACFLMSRYSHWLERRLKIGKAH